MLNQILAAKGFFFDLDGTLVDTNEADYLAYRDAIKEVTGKTVSREDFAKTTGIELREKLPILGFDLPERDIQRIAAGKKIHYPKYIHLTKRNEVLISFIRSHVEDKIMVLVTTAKQQNALLVLEAHGLKDYFTHMVFGDETTQPKPNPEAYLKALEITGLRPEEVIAFEDSEPGIKSAEAAGIRVIRMGEPA